MITTAKYLNRLLENAREEVIGLKVTDFEKDIKVIHLQNDEGRHFAIDFGGENPVVHAFLTTKEKLDHMEEMFDVLLERLEIEPDELLEILKERYE